MFLRYVAWLLFSVSVQADWMLGKLQNSSDIVFDQAWKSSTKGGLKVHTSLTEKLQQQRPALKEILPTVFNYKITKKGLVLRGHDPKGVVIDMYLDGQATHSVLWKRLKSNAHIPFPDYVDSAQGSWCARAVKVGVVDQKVLSNCLAYHDHAGQVYNVAVDGKDGNYSISLDPA